MNLNKQNKFKDRVRKEQKEWLTLSELPRDLLKGTRKMQSKCTGTDPKRDYIPKEKGEEQLNYELRVFRTRLLNIYKRTLNRLVGEVFSRDFAVADKLPEQMQKFFDGCDKSRKVSLKYFLKVLFRQGIHDGLCHVLIDKKKIRTKKAGSIIKYLDEATGKWLMYTKEVEKRMGIFPYLVMIKQKDILSWKETNGDVDSISFIEIIEEYDEKDKIKKVNQIRTYTTTDWKIERQSDEKKNKWVVYESGTHDFKMLPIVTCFFEEGSSALTADPSLLDLAELNLEHFASKSDQKNILHYGRLLTYFARNIVDENGEQSDVSIGANKVIHGSMDSDLRIIETSGNAIQAGKEDLETLKQEMALFGLSIMLGQRSGGLTATSHAIDSAESDSTLKEWAIKFEDYVNNQILDPIFKIMNETPVKGEVNTEFSITGMLSDYTMLFDGFDKGIFPLDFIYDELKRKGKIPQDTDNVELKAQLEDDTRRSMTGTPAIKTKDEEIEE